MITSNDVIVTGPRKTKNLLKKKEKKFFQDKFSRKFLVELVLSIQKPKKKWLTFIDNRIKTANIPCTLNDKANILEVFSKTCNKICAKNFVTHVLLLVVFEKRKLHLEKKSL